MKNFLIDEGQLLALEQLARRLHTEARMDGNEMRDSGHLLARIAEVVRQIEIPDVAPAASVPVAIKCSECGAEFTQADRKNYGKKAIKESLAEGLPLTCVACCEANT